MSVPNLDRFSGLGDIYDRYRPRPPAILVDILTQLSEVEQPSLVVDLGSGTGLSTALWLGRAREVVGVEPNADMRAKAEQQLAGGTSSTGIRILDGVSSRTGFPDGSADIVTVSQALHWMEPGPTFREVARILRPGGVFAAYDCDFPPITRWEADLAYHALLERTRAVAQDRATHQEVSRWEKSEHLGRIRQSGRFRFVREICVHSVEQGDADRLVGLIMSRAGIGRLLREGMSEQEMGLDHFRTEAERILGNDPVPWYWTYRVRIGVK